VILVSNNVVCKNISGPESFDYREEAQAVANDDGSIKQPAETVEKVGQTPASFHFIGNSYGSYFEIKCRRP
jgi:hypothetical protein